MSIEVETLFTAALGLQAPWAVAKVELNTAKGRIDFDIICQAKRMNCPICGGGEQRIHDRVGKEWRHLDFFQFEAWLHANVPRVSCAACGKTTQVAVPWAREGSGFTLMFEALALALCKELPVAHAADHMRVSAKRLWRRIAHYVSQARIKDDMREVKLIGIDETSVKKGHQYITVVHDLQAKRLLFATSGKDNTTVQSFTQDLSAHGGQPQAIEHVCMDMSAAFAKGVRENLPQAQISYDRFHVIAMASAAMDEVRKKEVRERPHQVRQALDSEDRKARKSMFWAIRRNPSTWSEAQWQVMHQLQKSNLQTAKARTSNDMGVAQTALKAWLSWARRCRLEPFKRLAATMQAHMSGIVRGMLDGRSNAYVEAMNGLLQQAKTAARGFRTVENFIAIAYLRMSKLKHLPLNPLTPATPRNYGVLVHRI